MTTEDGLLARVTRRVQQQICGMQGHDSLLHVDGGRMSLLCASCGHESPGWDLGPAAGRAEPAESVAVTTPRVVHVAYQAERRVA